MFGRQIKLDKHPLSYSIITISNINMNYFKYIRLVKQKHTGDPSFYFRCNNKFFSQLSNKLCLEVELNVYLRKQLLNYTNNNGAKMNSNNNNQCAKFNPSLEMSEKY